MMHRKRVHTTMAAAVITVIYLLACFNPQEKGDARNQYEMLPELLGSEESCVRCHGQVKGFASGHEPGVIGCASCHLGNPYSDDKDPSHKGMVLIPGNLSNANATCGNKACHPEIIEMVSNSLMTTMAGVVSTNRFVFDPQAPSKANPHIQNTNPEIPADSHLRQLCASCHLGNDKAKYGPISEKSRGGGCNACHLQYSESAQKELAVYLEAPEDKFNQYHPELTISVSNDHCFGCHSRSGRISTNYEGWHETTYSEIPKNDPSQFRILEDGRIFSKQQEDIHHSLGMECIDCHVVSELMGNGTRYQHKAEALEIQCSDCHISGKSKSISFDKLSDQEKRISGIRGAADHDMNFLQLQKTQASIINSFVDPEGTPFLIGKNSGDTFELSQPAKVCQKMETHGRLTCDACHTGWVSHCLGCHTAYDPSLNGYDLLSHQQTEGKWSESIGSFLAEPPVLGVVSESDINGESTEKIKTFLAGMILTIEMAQFPNEKKNDVIHRRLFTPGSAHTTQPSGRSCNSCHTNPLAIGYGRGQLTYQINGNSGKWIYESEYELSENDSLPQDAWIGFLSERTDLVSTRSNARPFSIEEQKRILTVGACLTCHREDSKTMINTLDNWGRVLMERSKECVMPAFE